MRVAIAGTYLLLMLALSPASVAIAQDTRVVGRLEALGSEIITSLKDQAGWRLAVMDFLLYIDKLSKQGVDEAAVAILETVLRDRGVQLVERRRLGQVVDEIGLGETGLLDPSTVAEAGKLLGANGMIIGSITEMGSAIVINVKLVEVESSEIIFTSFATVDREEMLQEAQKYVVVIGGERSLLLAGLGSALIPGVGQIYAKRSLKGVVYFALVAAGLAGYLYEGDQAEGFKADFDASKDKYGQSYRVADIAKYRQEMENANENYRETQELQQNIIMPATTAIYLLGVLDAVRSARHYNQEMQKKYALRIAPAPNGALASLEMRF
ncbi:MAG: DUF5683 domain-containing protein [Candidatus Neomarinimicrobiota bacterium]